jgi:phenylalanyl-tRNA synthetase beta chain
VIVAELSVTGLTAGSLAAVSSVSPRRFQPVERDLTVDIPDTVPAAEVARAIREAGGALLVEARLAGTYRGQPLGPDERSLTYRLWFGAGDLVPGDAQVDASIAQITGALAHLGARIRS